jgi:hypothetical protein
VSEARLRRAAVAARNLVPVVGVVALGWSAPHLVVAYCADTVLAMATVFALFFAHQFPPGGGGEAFYVTDLLSHFLTALAVAAIVAVPLAGPVAFLLARGGFDFAEALAEPRFRDALLLQVAIAFPLFGRELRAQAGLPLEALRLRERFGLVFVRWFALCALALSPLGALLGRAAGPVLVLLYAGLTIFGELAPTRMLAPFERDEPAPRRVRRQR